jgi:predicted TIM-barrel fold metal-dependent hydrolase
VTVIDAHVHLWDLIARPQPWTAQFPALQRSFLLPELESVLDDHGTDAAVVVQASDSTGETLDLLALAATTPRLSCSLRTHLPPTGSSAAAPQGRPCHPTSRQPGGG